MNIQSDSIKIDTPEKIVDILSQGITLGNLLNFSDEEYEALYALGYSFYNQAQYSDASKFFSYLLMHNPTEKRFITALGSSLQMLKRYEEAIQYHCMASVMDMDDPLPTFHTAECFIGLGHKKEAAEALEQVLLQCEGNPHWIELTHRSQALLSLVSPTASADTSSSALR